MPFTAVKVPMALICGSHWSWRASSAETVSTGLGAAWMKPAIIFGLKSKAYQAIAPPSPPRSTITRKKYMMRRNMGRLIGRLGLDVNDINLLDGSLLTDDKILRQTISLRNISP